MSRHTGHIELNRTVESIVVGNRHRTDLGDLTALAESIARDGLLQPLTVTIDGVLVCGARRLAAIKMLGWRTVSVWVRSGISGRLGHLLAEQDDNMLHKDLTPVEAAALYRAAAKEARKISSSAPNQDRSDQDAALEFTRVYIEGFNAMGKRGLDIDTYGREQIFEALVGLWEALPKTIDREALVVRVDSLRDF